MKIAFWSNMHGHAGMTSNLLAMTILQSLIYNYKTLIVQENNLLPYFDKIHNQTSGQLEGAISIYREQLALLNRSMILYDDYLETESFYSRDCMDCIGSEIIEFDFLFYDLNLRTSEKILPILQTMDYIIVNLSQNMNQIEDYYLNYKFDDRKTFYLIGNYDEHSKYSQHFFMKRYKWMTKQNLGFIPYNTEFKDAISDGNIVDYFLKNRFCNRKEENGEFMHQLHLALHKWMKFANIDRSVHLNELT